MTIKLTRGIAWKNCLAQWKWITENLDRDGLRSKSSKDRVDILKREWVEKNWRKGQTLIHSCFFCTFANSECMSKCSQCPGREVEVTFTCVHTNYNYHDSPQEFYRKLLRLDNKRRTQSKLG